MTDFATTATEGAARLETLTGALTHLEDTWARAQDGVQQLTQRVSTDTQALLGRLETLVSTVHQAREAVQVDVTTLEQALTEMEGQLSARQVQAEQVFQEAQAGFAALAECLDGLLTDVDGVVQRAEAAMQGLAGRAQGLEAALEESTRRTEQHLQDSLATATRQHQAEVEQALSALQHAIRSTAVPAMGAQVAQFAAHLDQQVERLQAGLTAAGGQAEGRTGEVLMRLAQDHQTQLQGLTQQVQGLATALHQVGSMLQTGMGTVTTTALLTEGATVANAGINVALGLLRETEELLHRVGV